VTIFEDFKERHPCGVVERLEAEVINHRSLFFLMRDRCFR
jgi:hypothetical protein